MTDVPRRSGPTRQVRRAGRSRFTTSFGASAAAIVALIACSSEPTPEPSGQAGHWEVAHIVEPEQDARLRKADFHGAEWHDEAGWIAYGLERSGEDRTPAIWASADGLSWTSTELPDAVKERGRTVVDVLIADQDGRNRLVALVTGPGGTQIVGSDDGTNWEHMADVPAEELRHVVHGPAGYLAMGGGTLEQWTLWSSVDGEEWVESDPGALSGASLIAIQAVDDRYVAAGVVYGPDSPPLSEASPPYSAWTSTDAADWAEHRIAPSSNVGCEFADGELGDLLCLTLVAEARGGRVVVLGRRGVAFAAVSDDGEEWALTDFENGVTLAAADVADDGAIVLAGHVCGDPYDPAGEAIIWARDADATDWRAVDWRTQVANAEDEIALQCVAGVAVGAERTLVLFHDGSVLLSPGRLP